METATEHIYQHLNAAMWDMQQGKRQLKQEGRMMLEDALDKVQNDLDDIMVELYSIMEDEG